MLQTRFLRFGSASECFCYPEGRSHFLSRSDMNFTENRTLKMSLRCSYFLKLKHLLCWFVTTTPNAQGADAREKPRQTKSFHSLHHLTSHHMNKCILMTTLPYCTGTMNTSIEEPYAKQPLVRHSAVGNKKKTLKNYSFLVIFMERNSLSENQLGSY